MDRFVIVLAKDAFPLAATVPSYWFIFNSQGTSNVPLMLVSLVLLTWRIVKTTKNAIWRQVRLEMCPKNSLKRTNKLCWPSYSFLKSKI